MLKLSVSKNCCIAIPTHQTRGVRIEGNEPIDRHDRKATLLNSDGFPIQDLYKSLTVNEAGDQAPAFTNDPVAKVSVMGASMAGNYSTAFASADANSAAMGQEFLQLFNFSL